MTSEVRTGVVKHYAALHRYARKLLRRTQDAEDLVTQAVERALTMEDKFRGGNVRAWLFTLLHNTYVNNIRDSKTLKRGGNPPIFNDLQPPNQDETVELHEIVRIILKFPRDQGRTMLRILIEGYDYEEAARLENIHVGTAKSRVHRGRELLAAKLAQSLSG